MKKIDISRSFKLAIDIMMCFLILLQSIKKGGFYTSDISFFISSITILGAFYGLFLIINYFVNKDNVCKKIVKLKDVRSTILLFLMLAISYVLPILFNTAANVVDSKFEFFRYASIFTLFIIIINSSDKKLYYYTLISVGLIQAFIGIDGLASRILQPYLRLLNSGYLSKDLTRLSGTIQYANTAGILIAISGVLILDKLKTYIGKMRGYNTKLNTLVVSTNFVLLTVSTLAIILTSSRVVLVIYTIALIIYLLKEKTNNLNILIILIVSYVLSFLGSNNILDLVLTNPDKVYFVFITYIILSIIAIRYIIKYIILNEKLSIKISEMGFNKRKITLVIVATFFVYVIVGVNLYKPLELSNNDKENVLLRQVYGIKNNEVNDIEISVKEKTEDSKYSIIIYEESNDFVFDVLTKFEYLDNETNKYIYSFIPKQDTFRLNVSLISYQGDISITEFKLNGHLKPLDYTILPSDIVFRFKESFYGSSSLRDRLHYIKDSYKIWLTSPVFGRGGEGFKHLYKDVQTLKYTSTEAHSSIIQIFVESGLIGGLSVCLLIFVVIRKNKYTVIKLAFVMYIVHSIIDLNFSYLTCLITFSILIGIMENNKSTTIEGK